MSDWLAMLIIRSANYAADPNILGRNFVFVLRPSWALEQWMTWVMSNQNYDPQKDGQAES